MNAVNFDQVTLAYGGRRVLSGVSFAIAQGEFVALLGANGSGKTTILRAILGLVRPQDGTISVLGTAPRRGNPA
ncbi:MAG: ATP-binding cassette domain-containing protein, partial [Rhizobiaceae bacterium]